MADESVPSLISSSNQGRLETADLVTFTEEILNAKLHFLCRTRRSHRCKIPPARRYQDLECRLSLQLSFLTVEITNTPRHHNIIISSFKTSFL